jgi:cytochrome c
MEDLKERRAKMNTVERLEVRQRVQEAVALFEHEGKEAVLTEIANPKGRFVEDDRYVFAVNLDGTMLAHPMNPELTGRNLIDLRDSDGRSFIRKIIDKARAKGYGFADYKWNGPKSKEELHKTSFFERVDGMVLCSGFYSTKEGFLDSIFECFRFYGPC